MSGHLGPRLLPQLQPLHALETESLGHRVGEAVRGFLPECALGCQVSWKWAVKRSGWCVCVCVCAVGVTQELRTDVGLKSLSLQLVEIVVLY